MKKAITILAFSILIISLVSCDKANELYNQMEGKWKLVKTGDNSNNIEYPAPEYQITREFKEDKTHIFYDPNGIVTGESRYTLTNTSIILYGDGFRTENIYWMVNDTLKIRYDGGFEYYDEYYTKQ